MEDSDWFMPAAHAPVCGALPPFGTNFSSATNVTHIPFQDHTAMRAHPSTRGVTVVVDSRDRNAIRFPEPGAYEFTLPTPLRNVTRAKLVSAEIPHSYYVFSAARGNTTLRVTIGSTDYDVTIPDGNYSADTMGETLEQRMEEVTGEPFTVLVSTATFRITLASVSGASFTIKTPPRTRGKVDWGLGYYLGFPEDATIASTAGSITGLRPAMFNPETYLVLDIKELGDVVEAEPLGVGGTASFYTFAKVPMNAMSFQTVFFDKILGVNDLRPPVSRLSKLTIKWRFHDGTPVDFGGIDHAFTLYLEASDVQPN